VFRSGLALGDFYLHDPWILAHAESTTYYLYTAGRVTQNGQRRSGVVVYKSQDLEDLGGPAAGLRRAGRAVGQSGARRLGAGGALLSRQVLPSRHAAQQRPAHRPADDRPVYLGALANRHLRATQVFVGESPEGPFSPHGTKPVTP